MSFQINRWPGLDERWRGDFDACICGQLNAELEVMSQNNPPMFNKPPFPGLNNTPARMLESPLVHRICQIEQGAEVAPPAFNVHLRLLAEIEALSLTHLSGRTQVLPAVPNLSWLRNLPFGQIFAVKKAILEKQIGLLERMRRHPKFFTKVDIQLKLLDKIEWRQNIVRDLEERIANESIWALPEHESIGKLPVLRAIQDPLYDMD